MGTVSVKQLVSNTGVESARDTKWQAQSYGYRGSSLIFGKVITHILTQCDLG